MVRNMRKLTGWGVKDRPFSPTEYKRSRIAEHDKLYSYKEYLTQYTRGLDKKKPIKAKKRTVKKGYNWF